LNNVVAFVRSALNNLVYGSNDNAANDKPFDGGHGDKAFDLSLAFNF
jgi:hypothetical protein